MSLKNPLSTIFSLQRKAYNPAEIAVLFFMIVVLGSFLSFFSIALNEGPPRDGSMSQAASTPEELQSALMKTEVESVNTGVLDSIKIVAEFRRELLEI